MVKTLPKFFLLILNKITNELYVHNKFSRKQNIWVRLKTHGFTILRLQGFVDFEKNNSKSNITIHDVLTY